MATYLFQAVVCRRKKPELAASVLALSGPASTVSFRLSFASRCEIRVRGSLGRRVHSVHMPREGAGSDRDELDTSQVFRNLEFRLKKYAQWPLLGFRLSLRAGCQSHGKPMGHPVAATHDMARTGNEARIKDHVHARGLSIQRGRSSLALRPATDSVSPWGVRARPISGAAGLASSPDWAREMDHSPQSGRWINSHLDAMRHGGNDDGISRFSWPLSESHTPCRLLCHAHHMTGLLPISCIAVAGLVDCPTSLWAANRPCCSNSSPP